DELLDRTFDWFEAHGPFQVRSGVYNEKAKKTKLLPHLAGAI
ncbi:MAG: hypothetical protein JWO38_3531, partial [Gemmataceae bacterium]|nr:hypothetical protein [Gemmataceae bacterium]MDB5309329.1 hypothetical protein [Gemmataceae bacterium]